jgi:hypothetical protein
MTIHHYTETATPDATRRDQTRPDATRRDPSDLNDREFDLVAPHVAQKAGSDKKRIVDIREVLNAIFYRTRPAVNGGAAEPMGSVRAFELAHLVHWQRERRQCDPLLCKSTLKSVFTWSRLALQRLLQRLDALAQVGDLDCAHRELQECCRRADLDPGGRRRQIAEQRRYSCASHVRTRERLSKSA